jgi:AcrR family transcriptional regulator
MGSLGADPPERGPLEVNDLPRDTVAPLERDRLVAAMAAACAEHGYAAATVEEVIARAEVPRDTFERNFADKAECGIAAVNQVLAEITAATSAAYPPNSSDWEGLLRGVSSLLELLAGRPAYAQLACVEARYSMPEEAYELYTSGIRVLEAMLDRLQSYAGAMRPASATRAAMGGAEMLIRRELLAGRAERLPKLLPDITYGLLVPFLGQREALRYAALARDVLSDAGENEVDRNDYGDAGRARAPFGRDARRGGKEGS